MTGDQTQTPITPSSSTRAKTAPIETSWLADRVRELVKQLKVYRGLNDEELAKRGGYTSRQVLNNRLSDRSDFSSEDLARIAAALSVEPQVLFMPLPEAMQWVLDNPKFKPPKYQKQTPTRGRSRL